MIYNFPTSNPKDIPVLDYLISGRKTVEGRPYSKNALYMPFPMNQENLHGVPTRKKVKDCRISLTFREII